MIILTRNIYFISVNCCYCFVQWIVCNLSVCKKVNRQHKHNFLCTEHDHRHPYWRITSPSAFHRELQNIYWKCHNQRRLYRWIQSIGICWQSKITDRITDGRCEFQKAGINTSLSSCTSWRNYQRTAKNMERN
jgi:hypothetical protein